MAEVLLARLDDVTAAQAGAIATVSNVGTVGVGVFKQKTGTDAEFYKINPGSTKVSFSIVGADRIDVDVVEANLTLGNMGGQVVTAQITDKAVTLAKIQDITSARLLGRFTAGAGVMEQVALNPTLSFDTGLGELQRAALTGDVTAPVGSNTTTIADNAVTFAKLQNMSAHTVLGRSSGFGDPAEITATVNETVLARSTVPDLQFMKIGTGFVDNDAITYAKMQNISAAQRVLGRNTAGAGDTEEVSAAQVLAWIGNTQGQILYRDGSGWTVLAPGTSGHFLKTQGAAANPVWAAASSKVAQRVIVTDATFTAISATTPALDDTIPQNTEGTQILTTSVTATVSTSILRIRTMLNVSQATSANVVAAIFRDSVADALSVGTAANIGTGVLGQVVASHDYAPADVSAHTINVRVGGASASAVNGTQAAGARRYGGASIAYLEIVEFLA